MKTQYGILYDVKRDGPVKFGDALLLDGKETPQDGKFIREKSARRRVPHAKHRSLPFKPKQLVLLKEVKHGNRNPA